MSLDIKPGQALPSAEPSPAWGELAPPDQTASVLRIVLPDRAVSYPTGELRRWEHQLGAPERLIVLAGAEEITVEGSELGPVHAALDGRRLAELRLTYRNKRPGPQIRRITLETA